MFVRVQLKYVENKEKFNVRSIRVDRYRSENDSTIFKRTIMFRVNRPNNLQIITYAHTNHRCGGSLFPKVF